MISNKKSKIPHVASELLHNPRSFLRAVLIIVAYLLAFVILDLITRQFEVLPGIVAWYPPAGLTYTLLLVFGVGFTPAVTIALFLSSIFIYHLPQSAYLLFLWALIISLIYSATAAFLRHRIHFDWQLRKLRDVVWFVFTTVLVSALLAILSVSSSALSSNMLQNDIFRAIFNWWIGETVGVLTVTPFMLIYVIPTLKRFTDGQPIRFPVGRSFSRPTLSIIIQVASLAFTLYWVFGAHVPEEFRPLFLITLPLIWIALQRGLKGASAAILLLNTGVVLAVWLFRFDSAQLSELELLMIISCIVGLLMGAVVTEGKQMEKVLRNKDELLHITSEMAKVGGWEFDTLTLEGTWTDEVARIHDLDPTNPTNVNLGISFYIPDSRIKIERAIKKAIESKHPYDLELQMISAKGNQKWVRTMGLPIIEDGKVIKIRGTFQDITKLKQAEEELVVANKELVFQNEEKEKRAAELIIANKELFFQNEEKEKRATELVIANKELVFQNEEKEKRAAELVIANKELLFQNEEKEKRAVELFSVQKETVRRLQNIEALSAIDQAISGSLDLSLTLSIVLEQVATQLNVDAAAVLLLNPHTQTLEYTAVHGFRSNAIKHSHLSLGEGLAGHTALEQRLVSVHDLRTEKEEFVHSDLLAGEDFVSYHGVPLIIKGQVKGVLEVFLRSHRTVDDEWLNFLVTMAGQVGIALDNASLYIDLQRSNTDLFNAFDSTINGWSHALDLRDKETEGHTMRVTEMAERFARALGIDEAEIVHIRRGALLHDIGKMGVPDGILLKPGKLTDEEWEIMIKHPQFAYDMLVPIAYLKPALDIPYCHHEKWDGSGYPRGLKGEQIPLAARLFAIVDVWDALSSDRPYRKAWTKKKTVEHIKAGSGTHFDPKLVELFLSVVGEKTNKH
jgi:putative nucleotidyltransferase with HDIG domain